MVCLPALLTLLVGAASSGSLAPLFGTPAMTMSLGEFEVDLARFESEVGAWEARLEASDDWAEKRKIRAQHPATSFAERMRGHFAAGDLHAADWCLGYLRKLKLPRKEREALRIQLYDALVGAGDPDLRERALQLMLKDSSFLREVKLTGLEQRVLCFIRSETDPGQRAYAVFQLGFELIQSRNEQESARGLSLVKGMLGAEGGVKLITEPPRELILGADMRKRAELLVFSTENLEIGKMAPGFEGRTIDGEKVTLAQTRGKVTVLSFFGFW